MQTQYLLEMFNFYFYGARLKSRCRKSEDFFKEYFCTLVVSVYACTGQRASCGITSVKCDSLGIKIGRSGSRLPCPPRHPAAPMALYSVRKRLWKGGFISQGEGRVSGSRVLTQDAKRCGFGALVPRQTRRGVHL